MSAAWCGPTICSEGRARMRTWANTHPSGASSPGIPSGLLRSPSPIPREDRPRIAVGPPTAEEMMFRNYGEYWRIAYKGKTLSVRNTKGLVYIGYLLQRPEESVAVYELSRLTESDSLDATGDDVEEQSEAMERARKAVTNRI